MHPPSRKAHKSGRKIFAFLISFDFCARFYPKVRRKSIFWVCG
ncbi:hypothetical protein CAMSH0001_0068 [Campylobacter showae RM3277]|uniref:Uncharacterized protein n=1 Tax=Campylobacter showae RM3277 TaxID=553219 RepID=C6RIX2_9BACT|nr:hypothetical protein CAMSH0001_0068 [Campylobacter showae RM3277]